MKLFLNLLLVFSCGIISCQAQVAQHGHAHNDYMHTRPLFEALESGFPSIEIDVFLHKNALIVSHTATGLDKKPDIEALYLKPIQKVIKENGGWVYKDHPGPVIFMIDIKTSGDDTYNKLKETLEKYKDILAVYHHDSIVKEGPIHILFSGNKPYEQLLKEYNSYATIDAEIKRLKESKYDAVITRYSDPWGTYFTWTGSGPMPTDEKARLDDLVSQAHKKGKDIRFYGAPDKETVWKELLDAHVDWINTDKLKENSHFVQVKAGTK